MRSLVISFALFTALSACNRQEPAQQQSGATDANATQAEDTTGKGVDRSHKGQSLPTVSFTAPDGSSTTLAKLRGPMLVNLWATWCAPCVKELPTLNALAQRQGGDGTLKVVAISQDMGPQPSVKAFLGKLGADRLDAYHDPKMALSGALGVEVLPTSILVDANGREVWRYVGDLDWTGTDAAKLLGEAAAH